MLLAGVVLFVIAGCAGMLLPDLSTIFASRLVLGVAVALTMTAQTALVGDYFTGDDRSALTGLQISARNFGGLVFISLAGWFAAISPRLPFVIYGVATAFLPLMWMVIKDPSRSSPNPDAKAGDHSPVPFSWGLVFTLLVLLQAATNMIFFVMPTQLSFFFRAVGYNSPMMTGSALGVLMLSGGLLALQYSRVQRVAGFILMLDVLSRTRPSLFRGGPSRNLARFAMGGVVFRESAPDFGGPSTLMFRNPVRLSSPRTSLA
jgi:predicted MFS family arabinose efflux permease